MRAADLLRGRPRAVLVELFAVANLAFLTLDVFIAHSVNAFHYPVERIPVGFGVAGAATLLAGLAVDSFDLRRGRARWAGHLVGWAAIAVGIAGLFLHLGSTFFETQTLKSLVYTAPFAAPLSFAGLGFLVLVNRIVPRETREWAQWVLFLAWGGFVGNFVLSLADHAQNGFFDAREWIPVIAAALAVGFLFLCLLRPADRPLLRTTAWLLVLQVIVGLLGFGLHVAADVAKPGTDLAQDILYGAPPFAPLLFADLAVLAGLGVGELLERERAAREGG